MTHVSLAATAAYLPERWMPAAEISLASGIPEAVLVEKFALRGKHIAAADEHVSDMSVRACEALLEETGVDPGSLDVVMYFGSMWKDFAVWQAAPWISHRIGATNAYAVEYDNVSCGTPVALRLARDMLIAEPELRNVLVVAACRESYLLDYTNERSRFMFSFGDGAVAGLLVKDGGRNELLGSFGLTDGSLSLQVKVAHGGSVHSQDGYRFLDVTDPASMKEQLDRTSLENFKRAADGALVRSGLTLADVAYVCPLHTKQSMHAALCDVLGIDVGRSEVLDDTGHMSGVDSLLGLDRAVRAGRVQDGDVVLLLAAGTGYTWAASVVRWGERA
ncbi:MAG: 3-oxoacyl-ACP synthase [Gaiellaceae bacterium]